MKTIVRSLPLLGILLLLAAAPAAGQDYDGLDWNQTHDTLASAVGVHAGKIGGTGLAFRVPVKWYLYLQTAGGIWHVEDDKRHNLGVSLNYLLRQDQRVRLYVTGGLGYFYHKERLDGGWDTDKAWNSGGGIGLEYLQGRRWSWKVDLAFIHESDDGDVRLSPQVGIFYYW